MFEYIEDESVIVRINSLSHKNFNGVIRALYSDELTKEDFIPTFLDAKQRRKAAFDPTALSSYSISLFIDYETYKIYCSTNRSFREKHKAVARGFTSEKRGISCVLNPSNSKHIDYFLFDFEQNGPLEDFEVLHE